MIYIPDHKFEDSMDFLLLINKNKSHYVYIKDFDRFMFHETKNKNKKNIFSKVPYSVLIVKMHWQNIKKFIYINGAQSVVFEKGTIKFKNCFKQIQVPFKVYAGFERNLDSVESYEGSYSKKSQDHIPCL